MNYTIGQPSFVSVLNQIDVDVYFPPYVAILLPDVILSKWNGEQKKDDEMESLLPASFKGTNSCPTRPWSVVVHVAQTVEGSMRKIKFWLEVFFYLVHCK